MTAEPELIVEANRRAKRTLVTIEHMQSENVQEWDRTIKTFSRPKYELPDGQVVDGREDVMRYWLDGRAQIPDQRNELISLEHFDGEQVLIQFWLRGTPPGSNEPFEARLWAVFDFDDDDLMINERVFMARPSADQIQGLVTTDGRPVDTTS